MNEFMYVCVYECIRKYVCMHVYVRMCALYCESKTLEDLYVLNYLGYAVPRHDVLSCTLCLRVCGLYRGGYIWGQQGTVPTKFEVGDCPCLRPLPIFLTAVIVFQVKNVPTL